MADRVTRSPIRFAVPQGACDCHVHIFGPARRFPYAPSRAYTPPDAPVEELRRLLRDLDLSRVVLVQPSVYAADNSAHVDAARQIGSGARIVAVIDDAITDAELESLHRAGTRGIRVNLVMSGVDDPTEGRRRLVAGMARVKPFGWHVQLLVQLPMLPALQREIAAAPVPVVIDHFGYAKGALGLDQPGWNSLVALARSGAAYVKLSSAYRCSERRPGFPDMAPLARALIAANPDRVLWGSDWPHPGGDRLPGRGLDEPDPFFPEDDGANLNLLADWAPDPAVRNKILVANPARLYGF
jgi:predicted TIM-barrel fold metal-dependent hydrolase